jgi:adenylate cyclase
VTRNVESQLVKKPDLLGLPDKPSIVVLPFKYSANNEELNIFAGGLTDDITTTLSKLSGLFVIARISSLAIEKKSGTVQEIAASLGVRYTLSGSVRGAGNRIRVSVELIDAREGRQMWAERYDRVMDDIFAIQDEISMHVATELQVQLSEGEQARLRYTTTEHIDAWKYWSQGLIHFRGTIVKQEMGRAREFWQKSLALDPDSSPLNAMARFLAYDQCTF